MKFNTKKLLSMALMGIFMVNVVSSLYGENDYGYGYVRQQMRTASQLASEAEQTTPATFASSEMLTPRPTMVPQQPISFPTNLGALRGPELTGTMRPAKINLPPTPPQNDTISCDQSWSGKQIALTGLASLAVVGALYSFGKGLWNRYQLNKIEQSLAPLGESEAFLNKEQNLYNWKILTYPDARALFDAGPKKVLADLWNDVNAGKFNKTEQLKGLSGLNMNNRKNIASVHAALLKRIEYEQAKLDEQMAYCDKWNVLTTYQNKLAQLKLSDQPLALIKGQQEQYGKLSQYMEKPNNVSDWMYSVYAPNYGRASKTWWDLYNKQQRLVEMRNMLQEMSQRMN